MPALWLSVCFGRGHARTQVAIQIVLLLQGDSGEIMILISQLAQLCTYSLHTHSFPSRVPAIIGQFSLSPP